MSSVPCLAKHESACTVCGGGLLSFLIGFFCPLCVPASAAFLSGIGLAFLPQKQVVFPLIAVLAVILLYGLVKGTMRHRDISPLLFGALGIAGVVVGRYIVGSAVLAYSGAFCIFAATIWNLVLPMRAESIKPFDPHALDHLLDATNV